MYRRRLVKISMTNMIVKEDENGDLYIDLPDGLMEEMGWDENTELVWTVADDGTIGLRKRTDDSSNEA